MFGADAGALGLRPRQSRHGDRRQRRRADRRHRRAARRDSRSRCSRRRRASSCTRRPATARRARGMRGMVASDIVAELRGVVNSPWTLILPRRSGDAARRRCARAARCPTSPGATCSSGSPASSAAARRRSRARSCARSASPARVTSPTFTLVEPTKRARGVVHHLDLYRLEPGAAALEGLGFRDLRGHAGARAGRMAGAAGEAPAARRICVSRLELAGHGPPDSCSRQAPRCGRAWLESCRPLLEE